MYFNANQVPGSYPDEVWSTMPGSIDVPTCYIISNYGRVYNMLTKTFNNIIVHNGSCIASLPGVIKRTCSLSIAKTELMCFDYYEGCEKDWAVFLDGNKQNLKLNNLAWKKKPRLPYAVCFWPNIPMQVQEEWRWITGELVPGIQEGSYMISNYGRVYSAFSKKLLVMNEDDRQGKYYYIKVILLDEKPVNLLIHQLVAKLFVPNPHPRLYNIVNHINGDTHNNCFYNLEWCTQQQNINHAIRTGLNAQLGEDSHYSKLTEDQVIEICKMYNEGTYSNTEIAEKFNVTPSMISNIINGNNWSHITYKYLRNVKNKWE